MNHDDQFCGYEDLAFFGKINAGISHELKNKLAVISETAGLMDDVLEMSKKPGKKQLETIVTCCKTIVEEVNRGFGVVKHMNSFSHSVDDLFTEVNLTETVALMVHITGFLSDACKVDVNSQPEFGPMVYTCPFRLQNLLYHCFVFAFKSAGLNGRIDVSITKDDDGAGRVAFSYALSQPCAPFASEDTKKIAASINAEIHIADDCRGFEILIPRLKEH
ncbi:MAG: HAMP domain-containing histidine kinase [Desulfobacteraceae bacterium]|nr:HAMP domain-containing histidine kinase [Desulfobacteraceae bacterium]